MVDPTRTTEDTPYTDRELFDELISEVKSHAHGLLEVLEELEKLRPATRDG